MQLKKGLLTFILLITTMLVPTLIYGQAYGKVTVDTLNMRTEPNTNSRNIGQLDQQDEVEILGRANNEWLKVRTNDGRTAYVSAQFVSIEEAEGTSNVSGLRLRDYPSTTGSNVLGTVSAGEKVVIEYTVEGWCKVIYDGKEGFVSQQYITSPFMNEIKSVPLSSVKRIVPSEQTTTGTNQTQASNKKDNDTETSKPVQTNSSKGATIVEDAKQFLGNPYVYGGNSLTNGVDCSGFTQQIMKRHGISISRTSRSQYANDGYKVSKGNLQKGDLVFYGYDGVISHVGIYIGGGQIIHANTSSTGIIISPLDGSGKPYVGAKRVID